MESVLFCHIFLALTLDFEYLSIWYLYIRYIILRIFWSKIVKKDKILKNQKIFMNTSGIENPKLDFENPESGEHSENISFFEKKFWKKKFKIFFLPFWLFLAYFPYWKNRPKIDQKTFFSDIDFFGWECWGFEPMFSGGQFGPKRHPKSLVWPSYPYFWNNRHS